MMLYNGLFWLLVMGHLLGDFYAQPRKLAVKKRESWRWRLVHWACYAVVIALSMYPIAFARGHWTAYLCVWLAVAGSHALIDWARDTWGRRYAEGHRRRAQALFFLDQGLHLAIILLVTLLFRVNVGRTLFNWLGDKTRIVLLFYIFRETSFRALSLLQMLCIFLVILKPANAALRVLSLKDGEPEASALSDRAVTVSALERVAVVLLMFAQQYTAIPLLFIGKAIVWHARGEKDEAAMEAYLLVTLASVLIAVVAVLVAGPVSEIPITVLTTDSMG